MDHNNTQGETSGGIMARSDGGNAMGSSHSIDGRTTMNSFDATVIEQQTSSNQENFQKEGGADRHQQIQRRSGAYEHRDAARTSTRKQ